jgi:hypothetical protein
MFWPSGLLHHRKQHAELVPARGHAAFGRSRRRRPEQDSNLRFRNLRRSASFVRYPIGGSAALAS